MTLAPEPITRCYFHCPLCNNLEHAQTFRLQGCYHGCKALPAKVIRAFGFTPYGEDPIEQGRKLRGDEGFGC